MRQIRRFLSDLSGATAIEYCLIGGLISVIAVVAITSIGMKLQTKYFGGVIAGLN